MTKRLAEILEAVGVYIAFYLIWLLPLPVASALGGWAGRTFGPKLRTTKRARVNLARILPEKTEAETQKIITDMWDNLGRTAFEFPRLSSMRMTRLPPWIELVGLENIAHVQKQDQATLFFSAHIANWEILAPLTHYLQVPMAFVYRKANNPWVEKLYQRRQHAYAELIPKGSEGSRRVITALKNKKSLALLIDQKMNEGIAVPFLGRPAMTAPALAHLSLKMKVPIQPCRVERIGGCRFRVTFYPALPQPDFTLQRQEATYKILCQVNEHIGAWIHENPGQWFWLHRRWPS